MKYLIASDIHGSAVCCEKLIARFEAERADRLFLLGDLLYHGPRNELPEGYSPKDVVTLLNSLKSRILCVRGNCDSEVDQMVLEFPVLADYAVIECSGRLIYATHGHIYGKDRLPPVAVGDIVLFGHTHIPELTEKENITFINPGSVSIPKNESSRGYVTLESGCFVWKDLCGNAFKEHRI